MKNIYSVYDKTAQTFSTPWTAPNDVHAMRTFRMEVNRAHDQNTIYLNPEDFSLHRCGAFEEETGNVTGTGPEKVAEASALINKE